MIKLNLLYNIPQTYGSEIRVRITKNGSVIEEALGTSSTDHPGVWLNISRLFGSFGGSVNPTSNSYGTITGTYIDTVTSNTVTTYGIEVSGTSSLYTYQIKSGSTITLMEIAQ
jgi:hypothetical protein